MQSIMVVITDLYVKPLDILLANQVDAFRPPYVTTRVDHHSNWSQNKLKKSKSQ